MYAMDHPYLTLWKRQLIYKGQCRYRGSYMSDHVLLNLLNELGKRDQMRGLSSILSVFAASLINSMTQEHEC